MLKSIFYARFHQEKGSTVLHQVPEGSVIPCLPSPVAQDPLFDYKSISDYIIPRREFCDRLVSICTSKHRIIGFPVCIHDDEKYIRNEFIFNFCLVLDEDAPYSAYASVTRKLARLFRNLEEQNQFLSREEGKEGVVIAGEEGYGGGGGSKIYALCEMILEDLNCYCECMIPIDDSNTVNLKLFPTRSPPPTIHPWHVPLSLVDFRLLATSTWDLTVQRIIPHINGINSVSRIASLADTDTLLTRRAIAHLVYYGCVCLLDIFQFAAVYAPTAEIGVFFADTEMQDECRRYVVSPHSPFGKALSSKASSSTLGGGGVGVGPAKASIATVRAGSRLNPANTTTTTSPPFPTATASDTAPPPTATTTPAAKQARPPLPSRATLLTLYSALRQGLPLRDWCVQNSHLLAHIDVRRLITFGKIKGFIYRSHRYAIAAKAGDLSSSGTDAEALVDPAAAARAKDKAWRKAVTSSGWTTPRGRVSPEERMRVQGGLLGAAGGVVSGGAGSAPGLPASFKGEDVAASGAGGTGTAGGVGSGQVEMPDLALVGYLDGEHCLDEICTDLKIPERDAVRKLKKAGGDVVFFHR